jgi:hypothetical protein
MLLFEEHVYPLLQMETAQINETTLLCYVAECSLWAELKGALV